MSSAAPGGGGGGAIELAGRGRGASVGVGFGSGGGWGRSSAANTGFVDGRSRGGRGARHAPGRYGLTSAYSAPEIGVGGGGGGGGGSGGGDNVFERSGGLSGRLGDPVRAQRYILPRGPDTRAPRTTTSTSFSGRGSRS